MAKINILNELLLSNGSIDDITYILGNADLTDYEKIYLFELHVKNLHLESIKASLETIANKKN